MELSKGKKKKITLGRECVSYGCSNTFYNSVGQPTGIGVTLSNVKMVRMDLR